MTITTILSSFACRIGDHLSCLISPCGCECHE